jgi:hypothetical protein
MPNVPNVLGVPPLSSYAPGGIPTLLVADAIQFVLSLFAPQWGIFLSGSPVILADNVVDFSYKQEWTVSDYPVEQGGFLSYDKVAVPYDARVRFSAGGSAADRQAFLNSIEAVADTLELFDVVTPERVYNSANIFHYDYRRASRNGVGLIIVDIWLVEIRTTATAAFSNTNQPSGASPVAGGQVQAKAPTNAEAATIGAVQ